MAAERKYGHAGAGPVRGLPELASDCLEGQPPAAGLGKTDAPVKALPALAFDLDPKAATSVLQLRLCLRQGATPARIALDLFRLYAAVNQLELSYRGAGLTPDEAFCDLAPNGGTMRVTFKPADLNAAGERLAKVVEAINTSPNGSAKGSSGLRFDSIERYVAELVLSVA